MPASEPAHGYLPRVVDAEIDESLQASAALLIEGPRACGKTWTARRFAASETLLDSGAGSRLAAGLDPASLLSGPAPRLLDEWQLAPAIWNPMRRACDERGRPGQFILTGSADPPDDITRHSGAGRLLRVRMRTMSLYESGESQGIVSLGELFGGGRCSAPESDLTLGDVVSAACRGGWPDLVRREARPSAAQRAVRGYLDEISRTDVSRVDGVRRDPAGIRRLLGSLARNVAGEASLATLAADTVGGTGETPAVHRRTVGAYLAALERVFAVEDLPAWRPHLRSRAQLRSMPKRHFADPSMAVAALAVDHKAVLDDLRFAGLLFESLAVRDLRVYSQANDCEVSHYRDSDGLEVDAIIQHRDGRWIAVEIKLGGATAIEQSVRSLKRLAARIDSDRTPPPERLVTVTATGLGFEHPEGVTVLPLTALGP